MDDMVMVIVVDTMVEVIKEDQFMGDMVVVDVRVVVVEEVQQMDDPIYFGTYHRPDFDHRS